MKVHLGPYRKNRSVKVEIQEHDVWSLDHTLALIIHPCLEQLKKVKHGSPKVDWEDVPRELRPSDDELHHYNHTGETDPNWHARWEYILDEMIYAFGEKSKDEITDDRAEASRISNGFRLFGKYYEALWD